MAEYETLIWLQLLLVESIYNLMFVKSQSQGLLGPSIGQALNDAAMQKVRTDIKYRMGIMVLPVSMSHCPMRSASFHLYMRRKAMHDLLLLHYS
jgi:hypothetical protein